MLRASIYADISLKKVKNKFLRVKLESGKLALIFEKKAWAVNAGTWLLKFQLKP